MKPLHSIGSDRLPAIILALAVGISAAIAYDSLREDKGRKFSVEDYHALPDSFASVEDARSWARGHPTGGHVDELELPGRDALVVFPHGSGIPVIKVGVYRRGMMRWKLVAQPGVPAGLRGEFLTATAEGAHVSVTGERSGTRSWLIDLSQTR